MGIFTVVLMDTIVSESNNKLDVDKLLTTTRK